MLDVISAPWRGLPQAFVQLYTQRASGLLTVRVGERWTRLYWSQGAPVYIESNTLDESLGRELVKQGKLGEEERQKLLLRAMESGSDLASLLIDGGRLTPAALFEALRQNYVRRAQHLFAWLDAQLAWQPDMDVPAGKLTIKLSAVQLLLEGVMEQLPSTLLQAELPAVGARQILRLNMDGLKRLRGMHLPDLHLRFLEAVRVGSEWQHLVKAIKLDDETARRLLYAFIVLQVVHEIRAEQAPVEPKRAAEALRDLQIDKPAPVTAALNFDLEAYTNRLTQKYLRFRSQSFFEIFGIPLDADAEQIDAAYLRFLSEYHPFHPPVASRPELVEKSSEIMLGAARAYVVLASPELKRSYLKRLLSDK